MLFLTPAALPSGPPPSAGASSLPANLPAGLAGHDQEKVRFKVIFLHAPSIPLI